MRVRHDLLVAVLVAEIVWSFYTSSRDLPSVADYAFKHREPTIFLNTASVDSDYISNNTYPESNKLTIFSCVNDGNGMQEFKSVMMDVLPEYRFMDLQVVGTGFAGRNQTKDALWINGLHSNEEDVFLMPIGGMGKCQPAAERWRTQEYRGKQVVTTGEDIDCPLTPNTTYCLGPRKAPSTNDRFLRLTYLQLVYWFYVRHQGRYDNTVTNATELFHFSKAPYSTKPRFLIYGQANCVDYRDEAFDRLSEIAPVHFGGRCRGKIFDQNDGKKIPVKTGVRLRNWWDNTKVYSGYRFCLVMEHSNTPGYITEKILMAFIGGCIPIYYGTTEIYEIFNPDVFVYYNISNPQPAIDRIAHLEKDPNAYDAVKALPVLKRDAVRDFFSFSDDIEGGHLRKQIREMLGLPKDDDVSIA